MKKQLQVLRLQPDGFVLTKGNMKVILEISERSELVCFHLFPPHYLTFIMNALDVHQNHANPRPYYSC